MRKLFITLAILFSSPSLHATCVMPQELEELSKRKFKIENKYPEFKKYVLEMIDNLQTLEKFAHCNLRELKSDIDREEEQKVDGFLTDIVALLSQPKLRDDETTLREIRPFYAQPSTISGKSLPSGGEQARKEKTIDVVARTHLPTTKLLYAQSQAMSHMVERLNELHVSHATYVSKGCLIAQTPEGIPLLNMIPVAKRFFHSATILFWQGERMVVENFLKINSKNVKDVKQWVNETNEWNGSAQKAAPVNGARGENSLETLGAATKLRTQILRTSIAVFKHQLAGFYINGWDLHDLGLLFPKLNPLFVAYGEKIGHPLFEQSPTPFISLEARIVNYDKKRGPLSKGVFSFTDTTNMLRTLDTFFDRGHVMRREELNLDAEKQVKQLGISPAWEKYLQEKVDAEATTSSNLFIQGAIEEKKHRFEKFEPESILATNTEGLQKAKLIKMILGDAHILPHLKSSSLYKTLHHYDFITKIFDFLDDSWHEGHRSTVDFDDSAKLKGLFRKAYCALQDSYTLIMDHLFLFYERHPLANTNNGNQSTT